MHRLTTATASSLLLALAALAMGCGGAEKKDSVTPNASEAEPGTSELGSDDEDAGASELKTAKKDACVGFEINNLEDLLAKSDCEVPNMKPDQVQNQDMKGKLEVTLAASPTKVAPGGKVDLVVTMANKTNAPMTLQFLIDPLARFETETYDAKKKRADMPPGTPPPPPKGHSAPPPAEKKVGKVTLAPNGSVHVHVPWDANKMKWAPEKVRGSAVERGYPRVPAGPLAKGTYTIKVITPLIGVFEGADREVSAPTVNVEVGR
ncbi:MAG TPA: hypothetical protein VM580_26225 [Labilithrix sp.]|nr:hypothetical protein [Labilithrix sp.]